MAVKNINDISYLFLAQSAFQASEQIRYDDITKAIEEEDIEKVKELIDPYDEYDETGFNDPAILDDHKFVLSETIRLNKLQFLQKILEGKQIKIFLGREAIECALDYENSQALQILLRYKQISDKYREDLIDSIMLGEDTEESRACIKVLKRGK